MVEKPEVISTDKARGGVTPHIVRYVLIASLVLAVIAMAFLLLGAPKGTQQGETSGATVAGPQ